ncbi:hypothetical protein KY328_04765 [Candidatus Woesearchaeota archaeon]|nr:hypothetical protein [Candidatus Woesearchaeota archaeon]MBW3022210.1 hypothetical protein [Candidatus Woesearchaeota archaeon]
MSPKEFMDMFGIVRADLGNLAHAVMYHLMQRIAGIDGTEDFHHGTPEEVLMKHTVFQMQHIAYDLKVQVWKDLVKIIKKHKPKTVVDGGCATGLDLIYLSVNFLDTRFIGYDRCPNVIAAARSRGMPLEFHVAQHGELEEHSDMLYTMFSTYDNLDFKRLTKGTKLFCHIDYEPDRLDFELLDEAEFDFPLEVKPRRRLYRVSE